VALIPNEDQSLLKRSARGFFADKAPVAHLRKLRDANGRPIAVAGITEV
jgi:hypothetical protein